VAEFSYKIGRIAPGRAQVECALTKPGQDLLNLIGLAEARQRQGQPKAHIRSV
jgi:hypothetical protein